MESISPILNDSLSTPLYLQLYGYIRNAILAGDILPGEKLPSLRKAARDLRLSVTTVEQAYAQLAVEGYISSRPQSGYYASSIPQEKRRDSEKGRGIGDMPLNPLEIDKNSLSYLDDTTLRSSYYDPACFDFGKWKKCMNRVLSDYSDFLLIEGDPQGEAPLRYEISKYIYQARGVRCVPDQIVIGAGTQQLTGLLCTLLSRLGIEYAAFEEPGYLPVREAFLDRGFKTTAVPLDRDGILIGKLPANIRSVAYVSPSNQFPTGAVMPVARCYELLSWAKENDSIIIEDDYNSELRYLGKAAPSLQGMDDNRRVVYLGSFSSTLFPSIKISYMVLPLPLMELFSGMLPVYTQTCSRTEQLTLALYMEKGLYQTNIKKLRNLYAQKMQLAAACLRRELADRASVLGASSGLHMLLSVNLPEGMTAKELCEAGKRLKLPLSPVTPSPQESPALLIFYYTRIPAAQIEKAVGDFANLLLSGSRMC